MFGSYSTARLFDITTVRFVKHVLVGSLHPYLELTEEQAETQRALLARCLQESPHGHIISQEMHTAIYQIESEKVKRVLTVYHIGFPKRPYWLDDPVMF
jgi:hypothetical protein